MIERLIRWSVAHRFTVLMAALAVVAAGILAVRDTPIDALPDLSDTQVIIRTTYEGKPPSVVEDQITYPLATTMLSAPGVKTVRGYSFFGDSFVYVLFADGTDLYWARSRVLEYLNQAQGRLPEAAKPTLGPDATGAGWVYEYALVDRTGRHDISELRSLQDWFLRYELKTVPGVAEVASIGGMVKEYQVVVDPLRLAAYGVTYGQVVEALRRGNQSTGGSVIPLAEAEYMVRSTGYLASLDDFRALPVKSGPNGVAVRLGDIGTVQLGPELRRGVAELNGEGEVAGGVVVLRSGADARKTLAGVKAKLAELRRSLPRGVTVVTTYDRSGLIDRAVANLTGKLAEEFIIVALVCGLLLWRMRSALVAIIALPIGVLAAFIVMRIQGVNANIMSLGGVAIAIGAMVDAMVVMIENAHKRLEAWQSSHPDQAIGEAERWKLTTDAAAEVGPALFFSLVIVTLSFAPVFTLQAQEGRLFRPLAFTKTYAMAAAAILSVTLAPVLMGYLIRGRIPSEQANPINRGLTRLYEPLLGWVLRHPRTTLVVAAVIFASTAWPLSRVGGEFMPAMDEGDLLYMPSALPGLSAQKASELLQQTDRMIKTVPEVETVFGKAGRAETATDPAPLEMFETIIHFKPRSQWRPGMTPERLVAALDRAVKAPGLSNVWTPPIRNRVDMQATGVKTPIGVKISGDDLAELDATAAEVERVAKGTPGVSSTFAERLTAGRYVDIDIDRAAAGRYGLNIADVQEMISGAVGGETVGQVVQGRARYPINVRYPRELRDSLEGLRDLSILTPSGQQITLSGVATVRIDDGPAMLRSENARPSTWVYVDVRGRDLSSTAADLQRRVARGVRLPPGVSLAYSGQFEYLARAAERLKLVVPATLAIIFLLLYATFGRFDEAALILLTLPFALTGGIWTLYLLGYHQSVATAVGFIALAGVSAEFGVVMLIYLKHALAARGPEADAKAVAEAVRDGAVLRVRPKTMTVAVILAGLMPILIGHGAGAEVMSRVAAPLVGGMLTAPLLSMFVIPAGYLLLRRRRAGRPRLETTSRRE